MRAIVKIGIDTWEEEGPESLPIHWKSYEISPDLLPDVTRWLDWAKKMNEGSKKWAEASNAILPKVLPIGYPEETK